MGRLLLLFVLIPIVEMMLLIRLGEMLGFWPTIALIIGTGLLGSYLARREGLSVWRQLQQRLQQGGLPGKELMDGVIILIAGALLITPGVLTDVVGMLGLLPISRAILRKRLYGRLEKSVQSGHVRVNMWGAPDPFSASPSYERPEPTAHQSMWQGTAREKPRFEGDA